MAVFLICEGDSNGLDNRVLDALVIQQHNLTVQIAPSGGSGGLRSVALYLRNLARNNVAISVEDRDYHHSRAQADAGWRKVGATRYTWRRHEIENYLLHPQVVVALFDSFRAASLRWAATLPATEADALALLQSLAAPLLENHAAEVLCVELREHASAGGNLQFGPARPPPLPGATVAGQPAWVLAIQQEAARLCAACTAAAAQPDLQPGAIAIRYRDLLAELQTTDFLKSEDFLLEMGGHELITALAAHLRTQGAPQRVTPGFLADELLRLLIPIYAPRATYQPDDFEELAAILVQFPP